MLRPKLTMCTFQETYDPAVYRRFMGADVANPSVIVIGDVVSVAPALALELAS